MLAQNQHGLALLAHLQASGGASADRAVATVLAAYNGGRVATAHMKFSFCQDHLWHHSITPPFPLPPPPRVGRGIVFPRLRTRIAVGSRCSFPLLGGSLWAGSWVRTMREPPEPERGIFFGRETSRSDFLEEHPFFWT